MRYVYFINQHSYLRKNITQDKIKRWKEEVN